ISRFFIEAAFLFVFPADYLDAENAEKTQRAQGVVYFLRNQRKNLLNLRESAFFIFRKFSLQNNMHMKVLLTAILVLFCFFISAQNISVNHLKNLKTRSIGPASMSGRVVAIDAVVSNPNTWYVGEASGGVWKTTNSGAT